MADPQQRGTDAAAPGAKPEPLPPGSDAVASSARPGLIASLRRLARTVFATARNRLELLVVELQEERHHFIGLLILAAATAMLGTMTLVALTLAVVLLAGPEHRAAAAAALVLVYLTGTVVAGWRLRRRLRDWRPFASTLDELRKDTACFDKGK